MQMAGVCGGKIVHDGILLPPGEPEDERDDAGDEDAGAKGEKEGKVFPFNVEVAGEFAQQREFTDKENDAADYCNHKSDGNQPLSHLWHGNPSLLPCSWWLVSLFFAVNAAAVLLTVKPQLFRDIDPFLPS
jgi:hypothetical protein